MRVLSWNLYHGRDFPPDKALFTLRSRLLRVTERNATHVQVNRPLRDEFAGWIAGHEWDVALLQEAPPLWFRELGTRARRERRPGAHVAERRAAAPAAAREPQPGPDRLVGGRVEPAASCASRARPRAPRA